jgi:uncharacterized protein (TIRG00374 family)
LENWLKKAARPAGAEASADAHTAAAPVGVARASAALNYVELVLFAAGAVLLVLLVRQTGWRRLLADIGLVGWGFAVIWMQEVLAIASSTLAWWYAIQPSSRSIPFLRLASFRIVGEGINRLTPTATVGGEFVRARLLGRVIGGREGTAAVTLAKFAETAGQVVFITCGLALLLPFIEALGAYRWAMFAVVVAASLGVVALLRMLDRGFFGIAARRLSALGIAPLWFRRHSEEIAEVDALVRDCLRRRPGDLALSVFWYAATFAVSVIEVALVFYFLDLPVTWQAVLGVEVLSVLVDGVLFFVPGKMGTSEGSKMLMFMLFGLPPEKGLALGLIRRAREMLWDFFGLAIYALERGRARERAEG